VMKLRQVKKVNLLFQSPINNAANSEPLPTWSTNSEIPQPTGHQTLLLLCLKR
jgi:hypothetical protein